MGQTEDKRVLLADLVGSGKPEAVLDEVLLILCEEYDDFNKSRFARAYNDTVLLYSGDYPGYRKCNTGYHDLAHTLDVLLALVRLIHGAKLAGKEISSYEAELAVTAAMLHDAGYIQHDYDRDGTGGKYTNEHVTRSIVFMRKYMTKRHYEEIDIDLCHNLIASTDLDVNFNVVPFASQNEQMIGRLMYTADLMGQMADRLYLEKLHVLYQEFIESKISGYENEKDLLRKTLGFTEMILERLRKDAPGSSGYMRKHFKARWGIDRDMYTESITNNIVYLKYILDQYDDDYVTQLNRGGIVQNMIPDKNN